MPSPMEEAKARFMSDLSRNIQRDMDMMMLDAIKGPTAGTTQRDDHAETFTWYTGFGDMHSAQHRAPKEEPPSSGRTYTNQFGHDMGKDLNRAGHLDRGFVTNQLASSNKHITLDPQDIKRHN